MLRPGPITVEGGRTCSDDDDDKYVCMYALLTNSFTQVCVCVLRTK
jgi:hypothetical protein